MSKKLELGMFVPTDKNGVQLEEPLLIKTVISFDEVDYNYDADEVFEYIKAKDRIIFYGFTSNFKNDVINENGNIRISFENDTPEIFVNEINQYVKIPGFTIETIDDLKQFGIIPMEELIIKFKSIDDYHRPVFKVQNKDFYIGSTQHLFSREDSDESIVRFFRTLNLSLELIYFGSRFNHEPNGGDLSKFKITLID